MVAWLASQVGYSNVTLQCADPSASLTVQFAAFGTPYGTCGNYFHNASCDASNATAFAESLCNGQSSCSIPSYPALGDPCYMTYKRLIVQATCSDGKGGSATPGPSSVYAAGVINHGSGDQKIIVINPNNAVVQVGMPVAGLTARVVDAASAFGPPRNITIDSTTLSLSEFAVAVVRVPTSSSL